MAKIEINGIIDSSVGSDEWVIDFCEWLESRVEYFAGGTQEVEDDE